MGKSADLVLFDQHPLSGYSKALKVWIDGNEYFDREKDLAARADFAKKKKLLLDKEAIPVRGPRGGADEAGPPAAAAGKEGDAR